jgi:hypothetical protein
MANENCLEGLRCPQCGSEEPFRVEVKVMMLIWDDGEDDDSMSAGRNWDDASYCECFECHHTGTVADFRIAAGDEAGGEDGEPHDQ